MVRGWGGRSDVELNKGQQNAKWHKMESVCIDSVRSKENDNDFLNPVFQNFSGKEFFSFLFPFLR